MKRVVFISLLLAVTPLAMAHTQDQTRDRVQDQTRTRIQDQTRTQTQDRSRERIYGSQLMTRSERATYRERLRAAKTQQERDRIRAEHHNLMQERARKRGISLPDMPAQPMHRGMPGQGSGSMPPRRGGGGSGG